MYDQLSLPHLSLSFSHSFILSSYLNFEGLQQPRPFFLIRQDGGFQQVCVCVCVCMVCMVCVYGVCLCAAPSRLEQHNIRTHTHRERENEDVNILATTSY